MIQKVGCIKEVGVGAVDKEQQLGTGTANLGKHTEKAIFSELMIIGSCNKECLILMILKVGCFKKAEAGAVDQEQQLGTG